MFEQQLNYILSFLKNGIFQIVTFIIIVIFLALYFTLNYKGRPSVSKLQEVNVYYKGEKVASRNIEL